MSDKTLWSSVKEAYEYARKRILGKRTKKGLAEAEAAILFCSQAEDAKSQYQHYAIEYERSKKTGNRLSLFWLTKAADNGYAPAQYDLGLHYLYGDSIQKDLFRALNYMEASAYQGYAEACRELVRLYSVGSIVRKNTVRADYWRSKLEGSSYAETHSLLDITHEMTIPEERKKRTQEEISRARRAALSFDKLFEKVEQEEVINADKSESFIINAGPGTGKTYTMTRKINSLIKQGLSPEKILVLSFTNAVVKEVSMRLHDLAELPDGVYGLENVEVRTFHSFAYKMIKEANQVEELEGWEKVNLDFSRLSYDDCMVKGAYLAELADDIMGALNGGTGYEYVLIDEIQDINHGKAKFVISILESCLKCGIPFLLLGDSCQAIYDYLDEKTSVEVKIPSMEFYRKVLDITAGKSKTVSFDINHRSSTKVQELSMPIRSALLADKVEDYPVRVIEYKEALTELSLDSIMQFLQEHPGKKVCLMERGNVAAKFLSAKLIGKGVDHTCILNIHRGLYPDWIAIIFGRITEDYLSEIILKPILERENYSVSEVEKLWGRIKKATGANNEIIPMRSVIIALLSHQLDDALEIEGKSSDLIVSNIHRSKGLEYDYVMIDKKFLTPRNKEEEEMRVLYVAMTRAREESFSLADVKTPSCRKIGYGERRFKTKLVSNVYRLEYLEILVKDGVTDVGPECFVIENMNASQQVIRNISMNDSVILQWDAIKNKYSINVDNIIIGWMTESFTKTVRYISHGDMPDSFDGLYIDNVYSYIGSVNSYRPKYEQQAKILSKEYGKNCIWNYVLFTGLAHANYTH